MFQLNFSELRKFCNYFYKGSRFAASPRDHGNEEGLGAIRLEISCILDLKRAFSFQVDADECLTTGGETS